MSTRNSVTKKVTAGFASLLLFSFVVVHTASADVLYDAFVDFEVSDGEQGWGVFTGQYTDAHQPDIQGPTSSILTASPAGGIITSTGNLYSMSTVPTYDVQATFLDDTEAFTSIAVQMATSGTYGANNFSAGGRTPDEFAHFGSKVVGGFTYNLYRAEWYGLNSSSVIGATITASPFNVHQSLAALRYDYVNTGNDSFNMQSIPEPGALSLMAALFGFVGLRRRRS